MIIVGWQEEGKFFVELPNGKKYKVLSFDPRRKSATILFQNKKLPVAYCHYANNIDEKYRPSEGLL